MADDSWRDTYDSWKLASPYDSDEPEPQTDPGECNLCRGSGVIGSTARGRFLGAGPLPDPPPAGVYEATCPGCGGTGEILAETEGEPNMDNNTQPDWPGVLAAHEAETAGEMRVIGDPSGIVSRGDAANSDRFDVLAVSIRPPHTGRVMATDLLRRDAEAFVSMAVMRRGVETEFFTVVPAGTHRDGEIAMREDAP